MKYEILRKGVCSFNAGSRDPSDCCCKDPPIPIPAPGSAEDKWERAYYEAVQSNYYEPKSGARWHDVDSLTRFLILYRTARVMPPRGKRERLLASSIDAVQSEFRQIQDLDLITLDLEGTDTPSSPLKTTCKKTYLTLNKATCRPGITNNPTAVGKTMHVLLPRLFVIWDDLIRKPRDFSGETPQESFDDYWNYLRMAQTGLVEALNDYPKKSSDIKTTQSLVENEFYKEGWKPITKLYDEACWAMVKGWLHFC